VLQELWDLLKGYAQQETLGPLKNLQRQLGFGLAGTFVFSLGYFLITLGVMRLLQTHELPLVGRFFIDHNYMQYLVAVIMLGAVCGWAGFKARGMGAPGLVTAADTGATNGPAPTVTVASAATAEEANP
jgi:hypothetical protein